MGPIQKVIFLGVIFFAEFAFATGPYILITKKTSYNGYATIVGRAQSDNGGTINITVENATIRYTTTADKDGQWAIVFRHSEETFIVRAWDSNTPDEVTEVSDKLPLPVLAAGWNKTVFAHGGQPTEYSSRMQVQTQLNSQIRSLKTRCDTEKSYFDLNRYPIHCNYWSNTFHCDGTAQVRCTPMGGN